MHKYRTAALLLRRRGFFTFWDWKGATWHVKINYTNRETNVYGDSEADMLKNNIELDVKVKCIEGGTTQAKVVECYHKSRVGKLTKVW